MKSMPNLPPPLRWACALGISSLLLAAPVRAGLVGYWNFDANTLVETSGFKPAGTHDGLAVGNVGYTTGVRGTAGALDLRNTFGAVKVMNSHNNNPSPNGPEGSYQNTFSEQLYNSPSGFSIAFWAKNRPKDDWSAWVSKKGEDSWGYQVRRRGGANYGTFTLRSSTGDDDPDGATTDFSDGRWHHLAAVYDPVAGQRILYVDGVAEITIADGGVVNTAGEYLMFGARHNDYGNPNNFQNFSRVALDEIRIYDNALSAADVQGLVGDPWIYVDSQPAAMQVGMPDLPVTVTVPASLVATKTVTVVVTSPAPGIATPAGGVGGVLTLTFPMGGGNVQTYDLHAVGSGVVTIQHTSPDSWVDGPKSVGVWPAAEPADGLVAYWNFNSDSLVETGGAAPAGLHDGEPLGSPAYSAGPAGFGRALDLTPANSAVRIRNSGGNDPVYVGTFDANLYNSWEGFSIAFWAKGLPANEWCPWIAKKGEDSWGYQVRKLGGGPSATFTLRSSDGNDDPGSTTTDFNDGRWHHLTAVYDPFNFQRRLYVDGVAQINITDGGLNPANTASEHLLLGARENNGGNPIQNISYGGNISLDEVRIYKKALGDGDVMNIVGSVVAAPSSLSLVSPSANDHFINILVPPSAVAAGPVTVVVTSDMPGVAVPENAVAGVLSITLPMGGGNSASFAVQANGPGTAHFTYTCATLPIAAYTTIAVQQPNINGLVAYWNFNSQTLAETAGFQPAGTHDGDPVGTVAYVPGLNGGYALDLRAANTAVRVKNSKLSDANYRTTFDAFMFGSPNGFSWTFWAKGLPASDWSSWLAKDGESFGYAIRRSGSSDQLAFTLRNSDGEEDPTSATAKITDNLWHHVAAIYDPVNFQRRMYLDGVEVINITDGNLISPPTGSPLFFGARDSSGDARFGRVIVDEIRAYDKALSVAEITTQVGSPLITLTPAQATMNVGDADFTATVTVPAGLVAAGNVDVTVTSANPAVAIPVGGAAGSLTLHFAMGGANTATVAIRAVGPGTTTFSGTSASSVVNGEVVVRVTAPVLVGHWLSGAESLAETSGYRPAGTHDGVAVGGNAGLLAFSSDQPADFTGKSLDLTAGNVGVMVANSASGDAGYQPTFDTDIAAKFSIAFWAKGFPGGWNPWVSKRGEDGIGWQLRRMSSDNIAGFTLRGVDNDDGWGSSINVNDNNWHHYVGIWDQASGTRRLYVDGVYSHTVNNTPGQTMSLAAGKSLGLGARAQGGAGFEAYFSGLLFDVRIYNDAISEARIQSLLTAPPVLTVQRWTGNQVRISWSTSFTGLTLEQTSTLPGGWAGSGLPVTVEGSENVVYAPDATGSLFFRLKK